MTALCGRPTVGQQPDSGARIRRGPCGKASRGMIQGRSGQRSAGTGQSAPTPVRSAGAGGMGGGVPWPCFRKKTEGVRVRGRIERDKRASGFGAGGLPVI